LYGTIQTLGPIRIFANLWRHPSRSPAPAINQCICFSLAKEIKGYLTHTVVLGHLVLGRTPAFQGTSQEFLGVVAAAATLRAEALKTWGLSMADSIVKI
jgi:hypothetical protein